MRALATVIALAATSVAFPMSASADPPKVAILVTGDPDAALVEHASELHSQLVESEDAITVADEAVVRALQGQASEAPEVGVLRRRGASAFREVGTLTGAHVLAIVRREAGEPVLEVYDVRAARLYEDSLALDGERSALRYVLRRARVSQRRELAPAQVAADEVAREEPEEAVDVTEEKTWIQKNWAYLAGGALLAGVITFFVVRQVRRDDDVPPPVLRFTPGGT